MRGNQNIIRSEGQVAFEKVKIARSNLLLMIAFTVLNIVLLVADADVMMLFSATVPYFAVMFGIFAEATAVGIVIALFILALYFVCWILSKKHYGWMITALVLFIIDTLIMGATYILAGDVSGILDAVIHIWVLYYLIIGVKYGYCLKKLPAEAFEEIALPEEKIEEQTASTDCPTPLRRADEEVKFRILLETTAFGHRICYRRVKRVNELVIDGYVYDEVKMLVEIAHSLKTVMDGHIIEVGFDGAVHSYIKIDGQIIEKKLRLY